MSCQTTQPHKQLKCVSDRKSRKKAVNNSNEITLDQDFNCPTVLDSHVEVATDSHSIVEGHIDSFGKVIPSTESDSKPCLTKSKTKCVKRTLVSKKEKLPIKEQLMNSPIRKPKKTFTSTPEMSSIMKESQAELYSIMGVNQLAMNTLIITNDSLDINGVKSLLDCSTSIEMSKPESNSTNNEDNIKTPVFEGNKEIYLV